jgi:hypothetical protein
VHQEVERAQVRHFVALDPAQTDAPDPALHHGGGERAPEPGIDLGRTGDDPVAIKM